jgi:hypothetical protein
MVSDYDDQPTWSVPRLGTLTPPVVPSRDGREVGVAVVRVFAEDVEEDPP